MSNWKDFPDTETLDTALALYIGQLLEQDIQGRGNASLAVSGGSTPKGLLRCLSKYDLNWEKVSITLVDERWVDLNSPDSNEQMVRDNLLQHRAASAKLIGLKTADNNDENTLMQAQHRIAAIDKPFSAVILGMGGDGHTASWFPQADNLLELLNPAGNAEVAFTDPVTAPHRRITLTFPAVVNSREVIVHIVGQEKRTVLQSATAASYPIAAILKQTSTPVTIWWAPL